MPPPDVARLDHRVSHLRVAYLVNQYPKVSHTFIRREIEALERQGVEVLRFAIRPSGETLADPADQLEQRHTRYVLASGPLALARAALQCLVQAPSRFAGSLKLAFKLGHRADRPLPLHLVYLLQACWLVQQFKPQPVQHLHAHFGTNPAEVALLAHALGGPPYSFTAHGPEEFDKPQSLKLQEKVERARFVVAISSYGRAQLCRWVEQTHWRKVNVVHCGLEEAFHAGQAQLAPGGTQLVCVGRLCEQKAQLLLVEALAQVVHEGHKVSLVLAGDGPMRPAIETRIQQLGLAHCVRITGWITPDEVRALLVASRALVLPSFAEGLPVVLMEAMSLGRPVITTYIAGIPELVTPGECGWLVPAGDVAALATAMGHCMQASSAALADMGAKGRARALARHDINESASQLRALFGCSAEAAAP